MSRSKIKAAERLLRITRTCKPAPWGGSCNCRLTLFPLMLPPVLDPDPEV